MGTPLPKAQRHTLTTPIGGVKLWGDPTKLAQFFPAATLDEFTDPPPVVASVGSTTVKRYPGDPNPYTRSAHARTTYRGVPRANGAIPGERFWCEIMVSNGLGGSKKKTYQFAYQGDFGAVRAGAEANNTIPFVLRNKSGVSYEITFGAPPGP